MGSYVLLTIAILYNILARCCFVLFTKLAKLIFLIFGVGRGYNGSLVGCVVTTIIITKLTLYVCPCVVSGMLNNGHKLDSLSVSTLSVVAIMACIFCGLYACIRVLTGSVFVGRI